MEKRRKTRTDVKNLSEHFSGFGLFRCLSVWLLLSCITDHYLSSTLSEAWHSLSTPDFAAFREKLAHGLPVDWMSDSSCRLTRLAFKRGEWSRGREECDRQDNSHWVTVCGTELQLRERERELLPSESFVFVSTFIWLPGKKTRIWVTTNQGKFDTREENNSKKSITCIEACFPFNLVPVFFPKAHHINNCIAWLSFRIFSLSLQAVC